jgi:hypothetical protein
MYLVIADLTASASYNLKLRWQRMQAKLIIYRAAAVETLRAKIAQQIYTVGKCKFLVDSQILNWTNKTCFLEELLGSLGSKKLATSEGSFTKVSLLPTSEVCGQKPESRRHSHNLFIVKIYTSFT